MATESQQLSIAVSTETQGATGTLTVPMEWTATRIVESYRREHRFESGHIYRNLRAPAEREIWEVSGEVFSSSEIDALRTFFDAHRGPEIPFFWTPPAPWDNQITARFMDEVLADRRIGSTVLGVSFRLEKCIS